MDAIKDLINKIIPSRAEGSRLRRALDFASGCQEKIRKIVKPC